MKNKQRIMINLTKQKFILFLSALVFVACSQQSKETENTMEEPVETVAPEYVGEEVSYSTDSVTMNGYIAYDKADTAKRPGILVVHEWWGHNDYSRQRADMLAELGYVALAVDMYGDGKEAAHPQDAMKFSSSVMSNIDEAKARFTKALEQLKANPMVDPEQIGAIGYCFGGSVVLTMANSGMDLDAVVAFHSGVQLPVMPEAGKLKAKVLVCNGADDPFVSPESVEAFKAAMDASGAQYKYVAYEGAVHAFTSKGADSLGAKFELPLKYNEAADKASWDEMKMMFSSVFN
ncbi:dienelactone hydrolase family protein [Fulvivirga lutimaris]|uniref:dienelactone hydrolase family protein n=1 Tax=Fulvivirga lutimaris TaxID=1819566 RepID=UPI001C884A30|nr:dienelactone hydrolase family protein [Fulvivirga lutimaris]